MAEEQPPGVPQLVVIGASAGGVDALSTLVSTLSPSLPAPIVIAQHLDPSRLSHLQEILARRSSVPVRSVEDRQQLQNGTVYVVPADRQVEISDHVVRVHAEAGRPRPSPSINLLLGSAAEAYGEQLIAVILTGLGSDGADGARRVKEMGGTVVIQNPQTASHPEMPLSLAPTTVDIVAELEAIGPLLMELLTGTYAPTQPDDDRRLRGLLEQVRARCGIDFSSYKEPTIRRRLQRRMLDTNSQTLEEYIRYLRRRPAEYERLASSFLIKLTDFFRDADLFNHLRDQVLPALIGEALAQRNELRLWSAGCATGEEAFSLAILTSELLGEDIEHFNVRIFATDLDADAVAFARRGVYPASALRHVPSELREKYFTHLDGGWEVRKSVRSQLIFGQHDLGQRAPFPRIDLVLCRNVLIYFTPELQRRALQLFAFALREGGYLVLGKAETTSPLAEHFAVVQPRLKVFRRHGQRVLIPASRLRDTPTAKRAPPIGRPSASDLARPAARGHDRPMSTGSSAERAEQVLLELPIGVVIVDRKYDIQSINATARRLLRIHTPAIGEDLIHHAQRGLANALRDAVDAALAGEERLSVVEESSLPDTPGAPRYVEISPFVLRTPSDPVERPELVVLMIADVTDREQWARQQRQALEEAQSRAQRDQQFLDESARSVRELVRANEDLAITNAGLRSTNEELLVGNEEALAATEEIETLNEEQQATNEELETLNEELQATVEELNATNEDLQARSLELQAQAATQETLMNCLDEERQRLDAVLASMSDAVMVVDAQGELLLTNPAFKDFFGERLPPLEDASGQPLGAGMHLGLMAARGESFTRSFTTQRADGSRRWFEASGQPIRTVATTGGVVVVRDVSERSLRQLQEQFVALAGHELRTPLTALRGSLQLAQRASGTQRDKRLERYLDIAMIQATLLGDLVQDLADVIRVQSGELPTLRRAVDLVELARNAVELARPMTDAQEIRLHVETESLPISGDARRLQQVILNLVANALQHGASPSGVDVRVRQVDGAAELSVADHGRGIAAEHRGHVFERFYRAEGGTGSGLGVGLFLVRSIISAHDGTIELDPTDGDGTRLVVRLPLAGTPA